MVTSILLTGVGGQGVITMANLITAHLQENVIKVTLIHATGMAQRGGRVTSEIRFSDDKTSVFGPRISSGGADYMIGMDRAEVVNSLGYMKKGGSLLYNDYALLPAEVALKKAKFPDSGEIEKLFQPVAGNIYLIGNPKEPMNMFTLGAFTEICSRDFESSGIFLVEGFEGTLKKNLKKRMEENLEAYYNGINWSKSKYLNEQP